MEISKKRIRMMREVLSHLVAIAEDKSSSELESDRRDADDILEAVDCFEELIHRHEEELIRR